MGWTIAHGALLGALVAICVKLGPDEGERFVFACMCAGASLGFFALTVVRALVLEVAAGEFVITKEVVEGDDQ